MDKKTKTITILSAVILVLLLVIGAGIYGYENNAYRLKTELQDAERINSELETELTASRDSVEELEQQNRNARKTVDGIRQYNNNAITAIRNGISEADGIDELLDAIESGLEQITKAIYLSDNSF